MKKVQLNSLTYRELREFFSSIGEKEYRAEQFYSFVHKNHGKNIKDINVFSKALRDKLNDIAEINNITTFKRFDSELDETKKYLFLLEDNNIIESVFMKYKHGQSACISTQVGCRMGCEFCASTKEGLVRHLTPSEMINQIYAMEEDLNENITNIVLMGSGEPLDNYENVLSFLNIIHDENGHNISYRNITLSTSGLVAKIYKLADEEIPITLSISLHSPFDEVRKTIMPIANTYTIKEIIDACKYYYKKTNRRITMEYTMMKGINDRDKDLKELIRLFKGLNCHINLIPLNPIEEFHNNRSEGDNIERFKRSLEEGGVTATIRREMGKDINAACGQLRRSYVEDRNKLF